MRRLRLAGLFLFAIGFALMVYLIVQYVYVPYDQQNHAGFSFIPIVGVVLFGAGLWLDSSGRKPRKH